jgi:MFS transporter, SP family, galactose:H+ symporter
VISGILSSHFGCRKTILIGAVIFAIGAILCSISPSMLPLIGARLFLGIAVDVASFTAPLYISEASPRKVRGSLTSVYQLMVTSFLPLQHVAISNRSAPNTFRQIFVTVVALPETASKDVPPIQPPAPFLSDNSSIFICYQPPRGARSRCS